MTVAYFGLIPARMLADFNPSADGSPSEHAVSRRFDGVMDKGDGDALRELVAARERRFTFGEYVGVLEPVWIQNRPEVSGHYLFLSASTSADHMQQLKGWVSFSLETVHVPDRHLMLVTSARERANDFSLTPRSLVVQPFWGETASGEPFEVDPGGTAFSREYDDRTSYDAADLTNAARFLRIHSGTVS